MEIILNISNNISVYSMEKCDENFKVNKFMYLSELTLFFVDI